jgi:hypothetical protein
MNRIDSIQATTGEEASSTDTLREKLADALVPGYQAEFDPDEAAQAGAFSEDALSEQDAAESDLDLVDTAVPADRAAAIEHRSQAPLRRV